MCVNCTYTDSDERCMQLYHTHSLLGARPCWEAANTLLKHDNCECPLCFSRFFGCGLPFPAKLEGCRVLDLGSGSGRDCFAFSKLVGESGHVTGLDMTEELVIREARPHSVWNLDFCTVLPFDLLLFRSQWLASMSSTIRRRLATRKPTCLSSRGTWRSSMRLEYRTTQLTLCCRFGKQTLFYITGLYFIIYTCDMDLWSDHKPNTRHLSWNSSSL